MPHASLNANNKWNSANKQLFDTLSSLVSIWQLYTDALQSTLCLTNNNHDQKTLQKTEQHLDIISKTKKPAEDQRLLTKLFVKIRNIFN